MRIPLQSHKARFIVVFLLVFLSSEFTHLDAQELRLFVYPQKASPGEVAVAIVGLRSNLERSLDEVEVSTIIPDGLQSFLSATAGGGCSNLLSNCIEGARLSWDLGKLQANQTKFMIFPMHLEGLSAWDHLPATVQLSVVSNWRDGGGLTDRASLTVVDGQTKPESRWNSSQDLRKGTLEVEISLPSDTARMGSTAAITIIISNRSDHSIHGVAAGMIVPHSVSSFLGSSATGTCFNLRNNCYPGQSLYLEVGQLGGQQSKALQVPLEITTSGFTTAIPICVVVNSDNSSGEAECRSLTILR